MLLLLNSRTATILKPLVGVAVLIIGLGDHRAVLAIIGGALLVWALVSLTSSATRLQ